METTEGMTDEQVKLAREAGQLSTRHLSGIKLYEGLKIGESLLVGRTWAMQQAGTNVPNGRGYAEQFHRWKRMFKFPEGKEAEAFYDAAIVCAANRTTAEAIIAALPLKQKAELGLFGLTRRVRLRLREEPEGAAQDQPKPKAEKESEEMRLQKKVAELSATLVQTRENPFPWWRGAAAVGARALYDDRADGGRADGKARQLLVALAREFRTRFPNQVNALLDELSAVLKGSEPEQNTQTND
jgi:hypothetical protein